MLKKGLQLILIIISYLFILLFIIIVIVNVPVNDIQIFLSFYSVYLLELIFILSIIAFLFNFKYIKKIFNKIENKYKFLLLGISIIGILMTSFIAPRVHRIYYDEDIYNNIGQCIADHRQAVMCNEGYYENNELKVIQGEYNKQPQGYPYLISVVFRLFGTNELFIFIFNNILLGLTVIVIFLIVFLLFKDMFAALIAALSYILIPINLHWYNTCAVESSTVFFISVTILALLIYIENKKNSNLFFFVCSLAFSLNFRPECVLIFLVIGLILLLKERTIFKSKYMYMFGALLLLLSTGIILHLYSVWNQSWGAATGGKLSFNQFAYNLFTNSVFYLNNREFPLLLTLFGITGLLFYNNIDYLKEKLIVLIWFLTFWGIFLFFYAGSYEYGQDVRFSILSYAPISVFIGLGVSFLRNLFKKRIKAITSILLILIIFNFTWFLPFISAEGEEAWGARMDHRYAVEFSRLLPDNSLVFTHNPNIFLLRKKSAIQSSTETYSPGIIESYLMRFRGGVYVHYNFWSNVDDPVQRGFTDTILNRYNYQIVKEYYYRNYKYGLYKIIGRR